MLNFKDILSYYPEKLKGFRENILKEYLQYHILDIVYSSDYNSKLVFLGETAIRIAHNSIRFSEDLDFDNKGLTKTDFVNISQTIKKQLALEGYTVEIKNVLEGAFHCYIRFPGLLFENGLSGHKEEKILIQLDAEPQKYDYAPDKHLLNKFGLFRYVNIVPLPLLLSQKIHAILTRKTAKGRDFFDVTFLFGKTEPDYDFLEERLNINTEKELISRLRQKTDTVDLKVLAKDIEPFLFDPDQKNRVLEFRRWLESI